MTVDNSPNILKIAEKYFGFKTDEKLISVIDDAYEYVNAQKENSWDIIFMDINFKADDPNISPPWKFLEKEFL